MRKACLIILTMIISLSSFSMAFAGSIEVVDVKTMNVEAQIKGTIVEYTLDVPSSWKKYVYVEKETSSNSKRIVEKIVFYYKPMSATASKTLLMELAVFKKEGWSTDLGYTKISENEKYVLAFKPDTKNPYVFGSDRLIFDTMAKDASRAAFIKDYVSFPTAKDDYVKFTISVNGKRIASPSVANALKVVYLPIREVCQELGYSVVWHAADDTVSISSGSFYTVLGKEINVKQKYNIFIIDGKSYVSTMFFLQVLKCSVEIDQYNNVRISKEGM